LQEIKIKIFINKRRCCSIKTIAMKKMMFLPVVCSLLFLSVGAFAQRDTAGYFSSFDNAKIFYQVKGEGSPIVLLHGFTNTGNGWKKNPLLDSLVSDGHRVVLIDLRGNGNSDKPSSAEGYANDAEAKDVIGLMKFLGMKKYDALGYSRGSIILARVMVLDKNCKRAVMGGMGADFTDPLWPRRINFYNALMHDTVPGYESFRKYITSQKLDPLTLAYQQKEQPSTSKEELAKIKIPVLIICGDADEDNGRAAELQQMIPNSKFVTVPGNHNAAGSTPIFANQVVTFLRQQKR
jgi:pimeloyl-ACP methyl ester carboxylesterase